MSPEANDGLMLTDASAAIRALAADPDRATPRQLWAALPDEDREKALQAYWEGPLELEPVVEAVAQQFSFRHATVAGWDAARVAPYGAPLRPRSPNTALWLLVALHMGERSDMLGDFLDQLGLAHKDGDLKDDDARASRDETRKAADFLAEGYPADEVATYFLVLHLREDNQFAPGLAEWLEREAGDAPVEETVSPQDGEPEPPAEPSEIQADAFTTLDRQMIRTVIDVAQGVEGSLNEDELEDLVAQLIHLNSDRHQSFFHAGFSDVVLDRGPRESLLAQNDTRLRWYWAGYVTGLARREAWDEIAAFYDSEQAVRDLGGTAPGPRGLAARMVFRALAEAGREGEGAAFLEPTVVAGQANLFRDVSQVANRLLKEDRPGEARSLYDLLNDSTSLMEARGVDTTQRPFLEARRRRAHAYRQLNEPRRAEEMLETLLSYEKDPGIRAMVQADLGLIDGGFRRLSDLRISATSDREALREALERGEQRFRAATEADVKYAAHGRFCLGVLELLRGGNEEAADHLEIALSVFETSPEDYAHGNLLAHTQLYLAAAISRAVQPSRAPKVRQLLEGGLSGGGELPPEWTSTVLAMLQMASEDLAREGAEAVLDAYGWERLDLLTEAGLGTESEPLTMALLRRADDEGRGATARAMDYRQVVPLLIHHRRPDEAARVLDWLEEQARNGVASDEFVELLEEADHHEPAWSRRDALWARVHVLEASGQYQDAAALLENEVHRVLTESEFGYLNKAEGLIRTMASYNASEERVNALRERLEAERAQHEEPETEDEERRKVDILFVGGNETQEQYDEDIRRELSEEDARINVTFQHPGWRSSWNKDLAAAEREIPKHDAVVVMSYMRTQLGRKIREAVDGPWRACSGTGKRAMKDSIKAAAYAARRHIARQEERMRS